MTTAEAIELAECVSLKLANTAPDEVTKALADELQNIWNNGFQEGHEVGRAEGWDMLMEQG